MQWDKAANGTYRYRLASRICVRDRGHGVFTLDDGHGISSQQGRFRLSHSASVLAWSRRWYRKPFSLAYTLRRRCWIYPLDSNVFYRLPVLPMGSVYVLKPRVSPKRYTSRKQPFVQVEPSEQRRRQCYHWLRSRPEGMIIKSLKSHHKRKITQHRIRNQDLTSH